MFMILLMVTCAFVKIYNIIHYYVDQWIEYHSEYARHMRITNKKSWDIVQEYMENEQTGNSNSEEEANDEEANDEEALQSSDEDNIPIIISLEGNIGSGKSTLLHKLKQFCPEFLEKHDIVIIQEPVSQWLEYTDPHDNESILTKFYNDPPKYALLFQLIIFETLINAIEDAMEENPHGRVFLCERSIASSLNVFASMLAEDGMINPLEMKFYKDMFSTDIHSKYFPDNIIYLTTPVDTCMERIQKRARANEHTITKEYITRCDIYHQKWIDEILDTCVDNSAYCLDPDNTDLLHVQYVLEKMMGKWP